MHVTKAILPFLRSQGHGGIGFTSSSTSWAPLPFMSHYSASKAALGTYVESLHKEVRSLGIQCVAFELGGFPTQLGQPRDTHGPSFGSEGPTIAAYGPLYNELGEMFAVNPTEFMPGDLRRGAKAMMDVVTRKGIAAERPWAVRVLLGSDAVASVRQKLDELTKLVNEWKDVSRSTDRDPEGYQPSPEMLRFTSILESGP
jgi:NAD(P)-dependent dehydrogenase (short-subunit alcohol dehydrogenase family)